MRFSNRQVHHNDSSSHPASLHPPWTQSSCSEKPIGSKNRIIDDEARKRFQHDVLQAPLHATNSRDLPIVCKHELKPSKNSKICTPFVLKCRKGFYREPRQRYALHARTGTRAIYSSSWFSFCKGHDFHEIDLFSQAGSARCLLAAGRCKCICNVE